MKPYKEDWHTSLVGRVKDIQFPVMAMCCLAKPSRSCVSYWVDSEVEMDKLLTNVGRGGGVKVWDVSVAGQAAKQARKVFSFAWTITGEHRVVV